MRLTHRQIEVFQAVMDSGQVTRAAELLHTSQPTVSRELARLEQVLGFALFDRVRGRLQPTPRAVALQQEVKASYLGLARIAATAEQLRLEPQGRLQVVGLPALTQSLLPWALQRLATEHPQAQVSLESLESPALEARLAEQRMDLGVVERREAPPACQLQTLWVADEVVVLPEGHALAARPVLMPTDLAGVPFISLAPSDPYRQQIDALFGQQAVTRQMRLDTTSAVSVCALVRQGLGVGVVNPLTALELAGPGLVVRRLGASIPFHVAVVRPAWRPAHPLRAALEAALAAAAADASGRLAALVQA